MVMNNTYNRQVAAQPTALNPNQRYVEEKDFWGEVGQAMLQTGQQLADTVAKIDNSRSKADMEQKFNERELEVKDVVRRTNEIKDISAREDFYNKEMERINKRYKDNIDFRYRKDFDEMVGLSDKKNWMDIQYYKARDINNETKAITLKNLSETAKQTIGADDGYAKILDNRAKSSLDDLLARGVISRFEYNEAIEGYNKEKLMGTLDYRLITDPEGLGLDLAKNTYGLDEKTLKTYNKKVTDELKINAVRSKARENTEMVANFNEALDLLSQRKDVPQNLMNKLPDKVQDAMQVRRQYAAVGQDVPTNPQTYNYLQKMFNEYPDRFRNLNIYEFAGELSTEDLVGFAGLQDQIIIDDHGKAQINPEVKKQNDLMNMAYSRMGWKDKKKNAEEIYQFNQLFSEEAAAMMRDKGRMLTTREQEQIVRDLTKEIALRRFGFDGSKAAAAITDEDKPYVEFDKIDADLKKRIDNKLAKQAIDLSVFDENTKEIFYEDLAGALSLSGDLRKQATARVIDRILKKSAEML